MPDSSPDRTSIDSLASPRSISGSERSQYPFPRQGSARRPLPYQAGGLIGGVLDSSRQTGGGLELSQNAISTLFQPPIVRTGIPQVSFPTSASYRPPTARDIPPVTLTNIRRVENSVFKPYLSQVGSIYESFQRAKAEQEEGSKLSHRRQSTADDSGKDGRPSHSRRSSSFTAGPSLIDAPQQRARQSGGTRRNTKAMTPLSTIPSVYFETDFHLSNPRTFDVVSERSEVIRPLSTSLPGDGSGFNSPASSITGRKVLATNAILQEKLSWYMDTVEIHLISSISSASTSFFAALSSLKELQQQTADAVMRIKILRTKLEKLDANMAEGGLKIVSMRRRKANLQRLGQAVEQLKDIVESIARAAQLVTSGDVDNAITALEKTESLIAGDTISNRNKTLLDLRGVRALDGAVQDIAELRRDIGRGFERRFLDALLGDLNQHLESVSIEETLRRWGSPMQRARGEHSRKPSTIPTYININRDFRQALAANISGLSRSNSLMPATVAFRAAVLRQVKALVRKYLPSSSDDDNVSTISASTQSNRARSQQEKSATLKQNLQSLDPEDAYTMLSHTYAGLGEFLRRLSTQFKVLLDITSGIGSPPSSAGMRSPMRSPSIGSVDGYLAAGSSNGRAISPGAVQREVNQALDMSSLLGQATDTAQSHISKILTVRADQSINLALPDFIRYVTLNRLFADECEAISGRGGASLRGIVDSHIHYFVKGFGLSQKRQLLDLMDIDQWDARDIASDESECLARLLEAYNKDASKWFVESRIWEPRQLANGSLTVGIGSPPRSATKDVIIDEQKFILPGSAYAVLRGVDKFEHLVSVIPSKTQELGMSLLEYLRQANSRVAQLILGAGATRSAGLKNITTKHLALASQTLSFLTALMPYVREFFRRHLSSFGALATDFDKVKRLFQDHQLAIHDKLVDIMTGRAAAHVASLKQIDWDADKEIVNDYAERLGKETTTLHRVLSKNLPETTVKLIMTPIFTNYRESLGKAFAEVVISSGAGRRRLVRDAEHLRSRLDRLEGSGDIGDYVVRVAQDKAIKRRPEKDGESGSSSGSRTSSSTGEAVAGQDRYPEVQADEQ
ncbi:MAG: Vacuolar protein sorting-associated protein 54 [Vezdaea aestivalis]|nr:MAG: Vacuolar protein sorting-associated protein 54 [Vezdaea aestivalis]